MSKNKFNKKGQEEMIGFGFIIIIVAVILLIFISFAIMRPSEGAAVESYEIESFIQSMLQYTTNCEDYRGHLSIQELIYSCQKNDVCSNGDLACEVLRDTLFEIVDESWKIENRPVEAYDLKIIVEEEELLSFSKGNKTDNFKGSTQKLPKEVDVMLSVYY
jgi:hypothetical protein